MEGLIALLILVLFRIVLVAVCLLLATPLILLIACFQGGGYLENVRRNYEWLYYRLNALLGG